MYADTRWHTLSVTATRLRLALSYFWFQVVRQIKIVFFSEIFNSQLGRSLSRSSGTWPSGLAKYRALHFCVTLSRSVFISCRLRIAIAIHSLDFKILRTKCSWYWSRLKTDSLNEMNISSINDKHATYTTKQFKSNTVTLKLNVLFRTFVKKKIKILIPNFKLTSSPLLPGSFSEPHSHILIHLSLLPSSWGTLEIHMFHHMILNISPLNSLQRE